MGKTRKQNMHALKKKMYFMYRAIFRQDLDGHSAHTRRIRFRGEGVGVIYRQAVVRI